MSDEIHLISDGDGLAVIGDPTAVEDFLVAEGLSSKDRELPRPSTVLSAGSAVAQGASVIAANWGRWVKITKESAQTVKKHGLMDSKTPGVQHAMVGRPGHIKSWLQIEKAPGVKAALNPAMLAGAAGVMAQLAMQQSMKEITDYLAAIDVKIDDVLRAQKDAVLAEMIGVGFVLDEAMTIREHSGRVNEVTWSKVQGSSETILRTQAYALRQLDGLAEKLERGEKIDNLAKAAREAESKVREWLAVLARCFQLQDALAVLELDRVLDSTPDDLDGHRVGLRAARQKRLDTIVQSGERLMARMDAAASLANTKVLLHPSKSPAVVRSRDQVARAVIDFHGRLGLESDRELGEAKRWVEAATEFKDKALVTGAGRVEASKRLGSEGLNRAKSVKGRLASGIAERTQRRRGSDDDENRDGKD